MDSFYSETQNSLLKHSPSETNMALRFTPTNQKIEETSERHSTTSTSRTSQRVGMKPNLEKYSVDLVKSRVFIDNKLKFQVNQKELLHHLLSFATRTPRTKSMVFNAPKKQLKTSTTLKLRATNSMLRKP
jgi:hypothetical protein